MPPRVETKIVVNVNAIVNGLADVRALGFSVEGVGKFATSAAGGLGRFDSSMSKSQREAIKLTTELRQLQRELDALNRKIARDGQFAVPGDISRAKTLADAIAVRERTLNEQNHLAAVKQIRERRQAILDANEADRKDIQKNFDDVAKKQKAADDEFDKRIAQRIAKRKKEQEIVAAGIEKEARGISRLSRLADRAVRPLAAIGNSVVGIFRQVVRQIEFMAAAFVLLALSTPALIFRALVKEGIAFNNEMEQARIGLAALIQATQSIFRNEQPNKPLEGIEAFTAATRIAENVTNRLFVKIIPLKATSADLIPIFNQIITSAAAAGLTIEQTEDTFVSLAAAAQILQIPIARLGTEIRLLLAGTVRATSRLGPALFGSSQAARDFVKEHRAAGDLFPALQKKLAAYNAALLVSTSSMAVLAENSKEVFQRLSALATSSLFDRIKEGLVKITQSFFDLNAGKIKPEFEGLFAFIDDQLGKVGTKLNDLLDRVIAYLIQTAAYIQQNQKYVSDIIFTLGQIGRQIGGILGDLISVVYQQDQARAKSYTWKTSLEVVATIFATIRDELKIVLGLLQAFFGTIVAAIILPLEAVLRVLGLISDKAKEAADNLRDARHAAFEFGKAGKDRFIEGVTFTTTRDQINAFNAADQREPDVRGLKFQKFVPNRSLEQQQKDFQKQQAGDFSFRPNPIADPAAGGGKGGGGDRLLNRLGELRKQTAELLRDLYATRLEIERAGEDRSFELFKSATDKQLAALNDTFKHRLVSTTDYYKEKTRLETAAIERERRHLVNQFKFAERETVAALGAIDAGFDAQAAEPKNKDARIQSELSRQRQLKVTAELNKLEEKRVKLNSQILLLDQRQVETKRQNAVALDDALETLRKTNEGVQQQLLDAQGRTTAAEIRRISEQYRDELLTVLTETNPATEALTDVIERIKQLGSVTSTQLLSILDQAGLKFEELSDETKALIALVKKLEQSAVFQGLQNESENLLGNLDLKRADIQDKINQGVIDEAVGRRAIAVAEREVRVELERVLALMEKLPGLTDKQKLALAQLKQQAAQTGREIDELGTTINEGIKSNISVIGDSLIDDFANIGANARKFLINLVQDIGKAILQTLILKRLFDALGLNRQGTQGPGSAGGPGGILSGLFGGTRGFATGGLADGSTGRTDSLLARLTRGEFVIKAASVRRVGTGLLHAINEGTIGRFVPSAESTVRTASAAKRQLPPKVVIALTEEDIANASMGRAGERVFVHHYNKLAKGRP